MAMQHLKCPECDNTTLFQVEATQRKALVVKLADSGDFEVLGEAEGVELEGPCRDPDTQYICHVCHSNDGLCVEAIPYDPEQEAEFSLWCVYDGLLTQIAEMLDATHHNVLEGPITAADYLAERGVLNPNHARRGLREADNREILERDVGHLRDQLRAAMNAANTLIDAFDELRYKVKGAS